MSTQWVNTLPDAGALHALLSSAADRIGIDDLDQLWIFPTRRIAIGESTVIVFSLFDQDPDRRRVTTARFTAARDKKGVATVQDRIDEQGSAPADSVERVVEGVLRRLGEDVEQPPRQVRIERSLQAWNDLLLDLGAPRPSPDAPEASTDDAVAEGSAQPSVQAEG